MSAKLSVVPMKGSACAAGKSMSGGYGSIRWTGGKWPKSQTVQPDDDPPVLRSVDADDPPGRLPVAEDVGGTEPASLRRAIATIAGITPKRSIECDRVIAALDRLAEK